VDLHPPKREVFDVAAQTNTDNKGVERPVENYRETPAGLYMSRTADHPRFSHLESWLLPALGLRASRFHFTAGNDPGWRTYLDVGAFSGPDAQGRWHSVDWYLDLIDVPGRPLELVDVDELFAAQTAGLLALPDAVRATEIAVAALTGTARAADDVQTWLEESVGAPLPWLERK